MDVLRYADAEAFFACQSRHVESKKAPPITGHKRPAVCLSSDGKMGGVVVLSGIYQIRNQINGKRYIGSSANLRKRRQGHFWDLRHGQHRNCHLQAAFNEHGENAFIFSILEETDPKKLVGREQHYFDILEPEYNFLPIAGSCLGYRHSEKSRKNMSAAHKGKRNHLYGKQRSKKTKQKISESWTFERRQRQSQSTSGKRNPNYGKHPNEETRRKMSVGHKGKRLGEGHRKNISKALKGRRLSDEHRRMLSEAQKAYWRRVHAAKNHASDPEQEEIPF